MSCCCENGNLWEGTEEINWNGSCSSYHLLLPLKYTSGTDRFEYLRGMQSLEYWSSSVLEQCKRQDTFISKCESHWHSIVYWKTFWFGCLQCKYVPIGQEILRVLEFLVHIQAVRLNKLPSFKERISDFRCSIYNEIGQVDNFTFCFPLGIRELWPDYTCGAASVNSLVLSSKLLCHLVEVPWTHLLHVNKTEL